MCKLEEPMVGLSLSACVRDIIEGRVNEIECGLIVAGTRFRNDEELEQVLNVYASSSWHSNPEEGIRVANRLIKAGKIVQPRLIDNGVELNIAHGHWVLTSANWVMDRDGNFSELCGGCGKLAPREDGCDYCEWLED
jgi:hypothetical protein